MSELGPVVVRHTIAAEQSEVWQALTNDEHRAPWWPSLQLTPQIDGEVSDSWETTTGETKTLTGAVDVLVPGLTLGFRWKEADHPSDRTVVVMIRPEDEDFSQTRVTVIESGFASLPNTAEAVQESTERWTSLIGTLEALHAPEIPEEEAATEAAAVDAEGDEPEFIEVDAIDDDATDSDIADTEEADADAADAADVTDAEVPDSTDAEEADADDADAEEPGASAEVAPGGDVEQAEGDASDDVTDDVIETEDAVEAEDVAEAEDTVEAEDVEDVTSDEPEAGTEDEIIEDDEAVSVEVENEQVPFVEILEEDIVEGETIDDDDFDSSTAILLPEVGASLTESVQITADLGVGEPVEVEELSEWELLLRGDNIEEH